MSPRIHVVAAAVFNGRGEVLIARRPVHVHQGGLWEFPGGKLEPGETPLAGLHRELHEELGIEPLHARPLIQIAHDYADKHVLLDVWRIDTYRGDAHGREGQPIAWRRPDTLDARDFPAANAAIVTAVKLPPVYLVTPEPRDMPNFLAHLESRFRAGIRLAQLRATTLAAHDFRDLAAVALDIARRYGAGLLLNTEPARAAELGAGLHLTSRRLMALERRPLGRDCWLAASCHNETELAAACRIGVDFVVVGPVFPTASHPGAPTLGLAGLTRLCERATVPVYALGGVSPAHIDALYQCGAQGAAGITAFW